MSKKHWTTYWRTGALTSLPQDFKANYDGEIEKFWLNTLMKYDSKEPQILDVCTGNGAIAILLQELAVKNDISVAVTAMDASDIKSTDIAKTHPEKNTYIAAINFIGNCLVEGMSDKLSAQFDLIVSQYGIEYCDTDEAARNVSELLKAGGELVFVAHTPDTAMQQFMLQEEAVYQYLEEVGLLSAFRRFAYNQSTVNGFKNKLQKILNTMRSHVELRTNSLFETWGHAGMNLFNMNNATLKNQRESVKDFYHKYEDARARANDMLAVTDKLVNQKEWYLTFERYGLALQEHDEIIYQQQHNVGHYYRFSKL